jgi:hypothetical protein
MLRIRSAARSPTVSCSPDRTPGCLCQCVSHARAATDAIVAHDDREECDGERTGGMQDVMADWHTGQYRTRRSGDRARCGRHTIERGAHPHE